ncbi:uncharacterized protein LOC132601854 [Lycium barbarum]|uniref:uncharacterized protein LOC132601854 n=1 Tax=Lycium barbarum TaxID=112863 RepID=UPI00293F19FE|nr:uncharacterized protein LOC132601854 [Lycium barbarum]
MDAIALVQRFRRPDIFLTITCNPSWAEIEENLLSTDKAQNRPELICRVFRAKIEELKKDILKNHIFGKVAAFMYTVEFQKRGLPHAHFLIILDDNYKILNPEAYDRFVCAEFPNPEINPHLYKLVTQHMIHGPCGQLDPTCPCMKKKDIKVVKYIYKYICKGHDKITFQIHNNETNIEIDEIKEYQSTRWVSVPEAVWRIFAFAISEMSPSVYHLQLHLDGQQFVSFKSTDNISRIVNNPMMKKTMLTEFLEMNRVDDYAKRERYYLRLLLMNVRVPKSYEDLLTANNTHCKTFRESAEKRGLLLSDNNLTECMSEAVSYQMPSSLRHLFAMLLTYCNPKELWEKIEAPMSEDFKNFPNMNTREIRYKVLNHINDILHSIGRDINEFKLIPKTIKASTLANEAKDVYYERNITVSEEDLLLQNKLNIEQRRAYNKILDRVFSSKSGAFFIDGPGGPVKAFYTVLY